MIGALVGWIFSLSYRHARRDSQLLYIVMGIDGAVLSGWLMCFFSEGGVSKFNLYSMIISVFGAFIIITLVRDLRILK